MYKPEALSDFFLENCALITFAQWISHIFESDLSQNTYSSCSRFHINKVWLYSTRQNFNPCTRQTDKGQTKPHRWKERSSKLLKFYSNSDRNLILLRQPPYHFFPLISAGFAHRQNNFLTSFFFIEIIPARALYWTIAQCNIFFVSFLNNVEVDNISVICDGTHWHTCKQYGGLASWWPNDGYPWHVQIGFFYVSFGKHRGNQSDPETNGDARPWQSISKRDIFKVFVSTAKHSGTYGSLCPASLYLSVR